MTWGFKSEGSRTVISQDGVARVAFNADGSMELLTPAANPTGNKIPTAGQLGFGKMYESPEQTITAGALITLAHGLGAKPKLLSLELVCKTAENGYSVGDCVNIPAHAGGYSTSNYGCTARLDATNIGLRLGSQVTTFLMLNSSGNAVGATNANWRLIVRAWA